MEMHVINHLVCQAAIVLQHIVVLSTCSFNQLLQYRLWPVRFSMPLVVICK